MGGHSHDSEQFWTMVRHLHITVQCPGGKLGSEEESNGSEEIN